jgi:hypothetical protein
VYAIIRLLRKYHELGGSKADIYQTEHEVKLAFLVAVDKKSKQLSQNFAKAAKGY